MNMIDWAKPVVDNEGFIHEVLYVGYFQAVTRAGTQLCLWDASTAKCLRSGFEHLELKNVNP